MTHRRQNGFTIIEILMFIAISGLLLIGALAGINGSINNSRFNDAVNSTTSYIQSQYGEVISGRNSRAANVNCTNGVVTSGGSSVAGMTGCVILGRLVEFNVGGTTISSRYIVGRDNANLALGDTAAVVAAVPVVPTAATDGSFSVPWSTQINRMTRGAVGVNYLAIIRSPVSERILFYSFNAGSNLTSLTSSHITDANLNQAVDICLRDDGNFTPRTGYVRIGTGQGQDVIRTDLTTTAGTCS